MTNHNTSAHEEAAIRVYTNEDTGKTWYEAYRHLPRVCYIKFKAMAPGEDFQKAYAKITGEDSGVICGFAANDVSFILEHFEKNGIDVEIED